MTNSRASLAARTAVSVALLFTLGCRPAAPLRIAVVGSEGAIAGASLAADDINEAGGINGRSIEVVAVLEGTGSSAKDAIATADRLANEPGILAVVGHSGSSRSLAASQVYNARGVPQVAPNASTPLFTQAGPYSFRLVAGDVHQAVFITNYIASLAPRPKVAIIYSNDDYGRALHEAIKRSLKTSGVPLAYESPFLELASFAERVDGVIAALVAGTPDILVWAGRAQELAMIRGLLSLALPDLRVLGTDAVGSFRAPNLDSHRPGDLRVGYVDTESPDVAFQALAARHAARAGIPFSDLPALSYDAVGVLAGAMRAGATSRDAIRGYLSGDVMRHSGHQGITGRITLDANGDAPPRHVLFVLRNDSLVRVAP